MTVSNPDMTEKLLRLDVERAVREALAGLGCVEVSLDGIAAYTAGNGTHMRIVFGSAVFLDIEAFKTASARCDGSK